MKNLFVMHTQYNILSALAILQQEYPEDENDIAVIAEFDITVDYVMKLTHEFRNVIILQDRFDQTNIWNRASVFQSKYKKAISFLSTEYDRVITAQEQYFDSLIVSKLQSQNPNLIWQSVEEDAYYAICQTNQTKDSFFKKVVKNFYYKLLLPLQYGRNFCYENVSCYGSNSGIQTIFLTYPQFARKELDTKDKKEVCSKYLIEAIQKLYAGNQDECELPNKSVIFASDLISRYSNGEKVYEQINDIFQKYRKEGYFLYIKYHPRELDRWEFPDDVGVIPASYPSELLFAQNRGKDIICIGNASTAIILSSKFGYKTFSLAKRVSKIQNQSIITFYNKIGIEFI